MGFPNTFVIPTYKDENGTGNGTGDTCTQVVGQQGWRAHLKKQYLMFGNAVCPPVIAVLAGSVLAHCQETSTTTGTTTTTTSPEQWQIHGLQVALELSLDSLLPTRREVAYKRLQGMGILP
jgi:hypothetical protein